MGTRRPAEEPKISGREAFGSHLEQQKKNLWSSQGRLGASWGPARASLEGREGAKISGRGDFGGIGGLGETSLSFMIRLSFILMMMVNDDNNDKNNDGSRRAYLAHRDGDWERRRVR